ncbi:MAG: MAE_28990/MAE_18760 family HEPN-like nuclease [Bacteroidales bacterium]|nr:MAE_28990/MAE_18760 family HEPN-like nuclease [Bacteroidales bacterium]MDD4216985.1 MAE_28990/MAE_18760 family HEPN-like nuclease [Bacteroidales bacterium]MDY0142333.1 MAE_28990/MAE_18760 family HEPN-like nuclease [Bacteroidales bacterium]
MDNTKLDFENRKLEIENYFKFLLIFDDDNTVIQYKKDSEVVVEKIQPQFQITLIANAFLILYNLIEATVRNSIIEIYTKVEDDELSFDKLSHNLQKIWIKQTTNKLKENHFKHETLRDYVLSLAKNILQKETIKLVKDKMDFSGNLDADEIRKLADKIGFEKAVNGRNLVKIKDKRNRLAHGEQTFYDVGKDFSVGDLNDFKNETFAYLSSIMNNIEKFIIDKNYTK